MSSITDLKTDFFEKAATSRKAMTLLKNAAVTVQCFELAVYFKDIEHSLPETEDVWTKACRATLADISTCFMANMEKAEIRDQPVFQAIAEMIEKFPIPERR